MVLTGGLQDTPSLESPREGSPENPQPDSMSTKDPS